MTINTIIVSPIKLTVLMFCGSMISACAQAPVEAPAAIPKVDISALPFAVQPPLPANAADATQTNSRDLRSSEQTLSNIAASTTPEAIPTENSLPDDPADNRPLPTSLTSLPKIVAIKQPLGRSENFTETPVETAAGTDTTVSDIAATQPPSPSPSLSQPTVITPDTTTETTQAPETPAETDDVVTNNSVEEISTVSVETPPSEPIRSPPVKGQNTASIPVSTYDGCKIIRIYGSYISVSITRNGTEALLVSLDLPREYNNLQAMVNYIAYADFEPASYYPYENETPAKIAELIRNGNVQCVLQES